MTCASSAAWAVRPVGLRPPLQWFQDFSASHPYQGVDDTLEPKGTCLRRPRQSSGAVTGSSRTRYDKTRQPPLLERDVLRRSATPFCIVIHRTRSRKWARVQPTMTPNPCAIPGGNQKHRKPQRWRSPARARRHPSAGAVPRPAGEWLLSSSCSPLLDFLFA